MHKRNPASVPGLLCLLCLLWPCLSSCSRKEGTAHSQVLRISQRNEPATLDPQLASLPDEFFVIRALSEGLLTPNPDGGAPRPGVAERWETSADGLTWTFHLRANARWSNGDPVTAGDFVHSVRRALGPTLGAPKASLFFALRNAREFMRGEISDPHQLGIAAPDATTLVLTLASPFPDLPALVASGPWIPVHSPTVERFGNNWTRPENFVGNGPFVLVEWSPNQRMAVRRSETYWNAAAIALPRIEFLAFDSGDTEERAWRAGQIDVTMAVPSSKLDGYRASPEHVLHTVPLHETRYLALNVRKPPLDDVRVRRALSLALDRGSLVGKVLKAGQQPAFHFVPPGLGGYRPAVQLSESAAEARRLLAEAGFPDGKNFPKLELATWPVATAQLEAIQQRWNDVLGIQVALVQREARVHLATLANGDYTLAFATAIPDYNSARDLLETMTTGHAGNYPHWSDADYDRAVAAGATADAERRLLEAVPVIPLYFNAKNFLLRPSVQGWREDALWTRYYDHVSIP